MTFRQDSNPAFYVSPQVNGGAGMQISAIETPSRPSRLPPAPRTKVVAIIQRVAKKHDVTVEQLISGKRRHDVRWARQEAAYVLFREANWSSRAIGEVLQCSAPIACKLRDLHKISTEKAKLLLSVDDLKRYESVERDDVLHRNMILEQERAIVSGQHLADSLAQSLDLLMRCAIVLAITVEHYPRAVRLSSVITLYNDACQALNYGYRQGATESLMFKNFSSLNKTFVSCGWPVATMPGQIPGSRILTKECNDWLDSRLPLPIRRAA